MPSASPTLESNSDFHYVLAEAVAEYLTANRPTRAVRVLDLLEALDSTNLQLAPDPKHNSGRALRDTERFQRKLHQGTRK